MKILTSSITTNLHPIKHYEKTNQIAKGIFNSPSKVKIEVSDIMISKAGIISPLVDSVIMRIRSEVTIRDKVHS